MASARRKKFATQVGSDILAAVRMIAKQEGRQLQVLMKKRWPIWLRSESMSVRARILWRPIRQATRSSRRFIKSWLSDGLLHRYRAPCDT